jgi:hypothetical protein
MFRLLGTLLLLNLQSIYGASDVHTDALLELLHTKLLPQPNTLPSSVRDAKKLLTSIGMTFETIHACPNGCILYRGEYADAQSCPKANCNKPRYRSDTIGDKIPQKVGLFLDFLQG